MRHPGFKPLSPLLVTVLLASTFAASAADVYRWVDDKGVTHYGDNASQAGSHTSTLKLFKTNEPDTADGRSPASPAPASDAGLSNQVRSEQCEKAKKRLEDYNNADQLLVTDEQGQQREITPDEKIEAIVRAKRETQDFCQGQ